MIVFLLRALCLPVCPAGLMYGCSSEILFSFCHCLVSMWIQVLAINTSVIHIILFCLNVETLVITDDAVVCRAVGMRVRKGQKYTFLLQFSCYCRYDLDMHMFASDKGVFKGHIGLINLISLGWHIDRSDQGLLIDWWLTKFKTYELGEIYSLRFEICAKQVAHGR